MEADSDDEGETELLGLTDGEGEDEGLSEGDALEIGEPTPTAPATVPLGAMLSPNVPGFSLTGVVSERSAVAKSPVESPATSCRLV